MSAGHPRGSVSGETLLTLSDGRRRRAAELAGGTHALAGVDEDLRAAVGDRFSVEATGRSPVLRLRTRLGHELVAGPGTGLIGFGGARALEELDEGDRIGVARRVPVFGEQDELPPADVEFLAFMTAVGSAAGDRPPVYQTKDPEAGEAFARAASRFGVVRAVQKPDGVRYAVTATGGETAPNEATRLLKRHGLRDTTIAERRVPGAIYTLTRPSLALYLGRLWSLMGSALVQRGPRGAPSVRAVFFTASEALSRDVQHLLLRFGVLSRPKFLPSDNAWAVAVSEAENVRALAEAVSGHAFGPRLRDLRAAVAVLPEVGKGRLDVIPVEAWEAVDRALRGAGKGRKFVKGLANVTFGRSNITRPRLALIADALNDEHLKAIAESEVVWDTVEELSPAGDGETFLLRATENTRGRWALAGHVVTGPR